MPCKGDGYGIRHKSHSSCPSVYCLNTARGNLWDRGCSYERARESDVVGGSMGSKHGSVKGG